MLDIKSKFQCDICLIGDCNTKTSNRKDYIALDNTVARETGLENNTDPFLSDLTLNELGIPTERVNSDNKFDTRGEKLLNFCKSTGLLIVNGRTGSDRQVENTTCVSKTKKGTTKSTLDYALATHTLFQNIVDFNVDILDTTLSDKHCPISLTLSKQSTENASAQPSASPALPSKPDEITGNIKKDFKAKWDSDKQSQFKESFHIEQIRVILSKIIEKHSKDLTQPDIDSLTNKINCVYKEAGSTVGMVKVLENINVNFTMKKFKMKTPDQPWFTKECAKGRKLLYSAKHKHRKLKSGASEARVKFVSSKYKSEICKSRHAYNKKNHKKLRNFKSTNPKDYWAILNNDKGNKTAKIATKILLEHFKKLSGTPSDTGSTENINSEPHIEDNTSFNALFSEEEIGKHTIKLKNGKASGIDCIINEFIKHSPPEMISLLSSYFNLILNNGIIPFDWSLKVIIPIYKNKGDIHNPDNYRGITLLSCIAKLFTMIINTRLSIFSRK